MMGLFWGGTDRCNIFVKKTSRDSGVLGRGRVGCLATGFAHTVPDGRTVKGEGGRFKDELGHARLQSILRLACKASRRLGKLVCNVTWHPNWGQVFRKDEKYNLVLALHISSSKSNTVTLTIEFRLRRSFSLFFANKILAVQQKKRKEIGPFQPSKNGRGIVVVVVEVALLVALANHPASGLRRINSLDGGARCLPTRRTDGRRVRLVPPVADKQRMCARASNKFFYFYFLARRDGREKDGRSFVF